MDLLADKHITHLQNHHSHYHDHHILLILHESLIHKYHFVDRRYIFHILQNTLIELSHMIFCHLDDILIVVVVLLVHMHLLSCLHNYFSDQYLHHTDSYHEDHK